MTRQEIREYFENSHGSIVRESVLNLIDELDAKDEQLKHTIVPKFKIGQEVWYLSEQHRMFRLKVYSLILGEHGISYRLADKGSMRFLLYERELFASREAAEAARKENV